MFYSKVFDVSQPKFCMFYRFIDLLSVCVCGAYAYGMDQYKTKSPEQKTNGCEKNNSRNSDSKENHKHFHRQKLQLQLQLLKLFVPSNAKAISFWLSFFSSTHFNSKHLVFPRSSFSRRSNSGDGENSVLFIRYINRLDDAVPYGAKKVVVKLNTGCMENAK